MYKTFKFFIEFLIFFMTLGFSANLAVAKLDVLESNPTHQSLLKTEKSLKKTTESTLPMKHTLTEPIFVVKGEHEGIILRYTNETYDSGKVKKNRKQISSSHCKYKSWRTRTLSIFDNSW